MSYKAQIELLLHLHILKNIQISKQGYAAVKISIYNQSSTDHWNAFPYNSISGNLVGSNGVVAQSKIGEEGCISSTVKIQYKGMGFYDVLDDQYEINDIFQLKLVVDAFPNLDCRRVFIKLTLLFSSLYSYNNYMDEKQNAVESIVLKLQNLQQGIFHYYQAEFKENYASSISFVLLGMVANYKIFGYIMKNQNGSSLEEDDKNKNKERQKINTLQLFVKWIDQNMKLQKNSILYFYNNFAKKLRLNSTEIKNRAYEYYTIKKQKKYELPKFISKSQNITKQYFYEYMNKPNDQNISLTDYETQIFELHKSNYFFIQELHKAIQKKQINTKMLQNQFKIYRYQQYYPHIIKDIKFGQQFVNISHAYQNIKLAQQIRKYQQKQKIYPIKDNISKIQQFLFYQICYSTSYLQKQIDRLKNQLPYRYNQSSMMIFLCHGYHASSSDMRIIQRGIKESLPLAKVYSSSGYQSDTDGDIDMMGEKLATQVKQRIRYEDIRAKQVILNFVGHSMGGIVVRAALKYLKIYQNQFGFYCSLSTPHLGYMNGTDSMIKAGMWVMRKLTKQPKSLNQLSMVDENSVEKSFLFKLSKSGNLKKFKKIILISSAEDSYVPWHSARICGYEKKIKNDNQLKMIDCIIGDETIHRIDVNFACQKKDLDGLIGRKAHINLLINYNMFKLINSVITKLFDIREI